MWVIIDIRVGLKHADCEKVAITLFRMHCLGADAW